MTKDDEREDKDGQAAVRANNEGKEREPTLSCRAIHDLESRGGEK